MNFMDSTNFRYAKISKAGTDLEIMQYIFMPSD